MTSIIQLQGPFKGGADITDADITLEGNVSHVAISAPINHQIKINKEEDNIITIGKSKMIDYESDSIETLTFCQNKGSATTITYTYTKKEADGNEANN